MLVRTEPKQAARVNKPLIVAVAAILVFLFLWAIVSSLSETGSTIGPTKAAKNGATEKSSQLAAPLKNIPEDYNDMNAVAKYAGGFQNTSFAALQNSFAELKSENEQMQQQLMALAQARPHRTENVGSADSEQARSSALFFSGVGQEQGLFGSVATGGLIHNAGGAGGNGGPGGGSNQQYIPATPQQAAFFNQQNENAQRVAVMKATDNPEDIYDLHNMVTPVSPFEIQAGTVIPAVLITGINTTLSGTVVAQVRQSIYDSVTGKFLLVPKGSKLLGEYDTRITAGQRRVLISFNRIIRPDGSSVLLGKPNNADLQGASGNEGDVDNHWSRILGAATISTILSIGAGVVSDNNSGNNNALYPNGRQGSILGAANGISGVGQSMVNKAIDIAPTITLPAGYEFNVIVKRDMVLTPYARASTPFK
jgi:type IV secretion system protein TrbI